MERLLALTLLCLLVYFTTVASQQDNVCLRPELAAHVKTNGLQRFFNPGQELTLSCHQGYTPMRGPLRIVCGDSGEWTKTKLLCIPKRCPAPEPLAHGDSFYEDVAFQSRINFTCDEGHTLTGDSTVVCLSNGLWSAQVPECKRV